MTKTEIMVNYALEMLGTSYRWGGATPMGGFDCSGLVQEGLRSIGMISARVDHNSQMLHDALIKTCKQQGIEYGAILFFGKSKTQITHCAIAFHQGLMIEAGGGGSKTSTLADAIKDEAFVRVRPIGNRKDLVASLILNT